MTHIHSEIPRDAVMMTRVQMLHPCFFKNHTINSREVAVESLKFTELPRALGVPLVDASKIIHETNQIIQVDT